MLSITACSQREELNSYYYCAKLKLSCSRENQNVSFKTSKGDFEVILFAKDNPVTVSNFIENIKKNIYSSQKFYKIINFPQVKVIHSGIYPENNYLLSENQIQNRLYPSIPLEIRFTKNVEPKYKYQVEDPSEIENLKNYFQKGSIAMVKSGKRKSSSTEFFFVTNEIPELNGRYSIFGKIVKGLDVLDKIGKGDYIYEIRISN